MLKKKKKKKKIELTKLCNDLEYTRVFTKHLLLSLLCFFKPHLILIGMYLNPHFPDFFSITPALQTL